MARIYIRLPDEERKKRRNESVSKWRKNNKERLKNEARSWRINNPIKYLLRSAKNRAKEKGLEFSISVEDFKFLPEICPVLGIKLIYCSGGYHEPGSASLDRHDNLKGYTKDNTRVISWRANELKANGSLEEFKALVKYLENE